MVYWIITLQNTTLGIMDDNIGILVVVIILNFYKVSRIFPIVVCTVITINTALMLNDILITSLITFKNISASSIYYNPFTNGLVLMVFLITDLIILAVLKHFKLSLFEEGEIFNLERLNNNTKYRKKYLISIMGLSW